MKPGPFAVSVIWGEGHHYFLGYRDTIEEAHKLSAGQAAVLTRRKQKKGFRPTILIWEKKAMINP